MKPKDEKKPESKSKRLPGSKIAAIVALVVVLAAGVAGGVTYQMELWGGKIVPDVTGMTQADATYMLQNKGFAVRSTTVPSDSTEGLVLLMDPGAGARQQEGAEVVIHVSTSRTVPKVVGSSQDSALKALSDNGFENVDVQLERSDEPEGTVLSVSPEEGEKAKASTSITLKVAQAYTVPDVSGMSYNQAVQAIKDAGLSSTAVYVYSETTSEGAIMGVEPAAGSKVPSDTVVVVSLAKSRASELTAAARSYLTSTTLTASDGSSFTVSSVDSVSYQGNDTVAFSRIGQGFKVGIGSGADHIGRGEFETGIGYHNLRLLEQRRVGIVQITRGAKHLQRPRARAAKDQVGGVGSYPVPACAGWLADSGSCERSPKTYQPVQLPAGAVFAGGCALRPRAFARYRQGSAFGHRQCRAA